jgi:hypothetical protein
MPAATQADFDEAVRVNMSDFDMGPDAAVVAAVEELEMQVTSEREGGETRASAHPREEKTRRHPCPPPRLLSHMPTHTKSCHRH